MSTNYAFWDDFDGDAEIRKLDEDVKAEQSRISLLQKQNKHNKEYDLERKVLKNKAAALKSKAAVDALKARIKVQKSSGRNKSLECAESSEETLAQLPVSSLELQDDQASVFSNLVDQIMDLFSSRLPHTNIDDNSQFLNDAKSFRLLGKLGQSRFNLVQATGENPDVMKAMIGIDKAVWAQAGHVAVSWARACFRRREYALAVELTRYRLRELQQKLDAAMNMSQDANAFPRIRQEEQADVWCLRSLALAGIGSAHLALRSARQARRLLREHPGLDQAIQFLEEEEFIFALRAQSRSFEEILMCELYWLLADAATELKLPFEAVKSLSSLLRVDETETLASTGFHTLGLIQLFDLDNTWFDLAAASEDNYRLLLTSRLVHFRKELDIDEHLMENLVKSFEEWVAQGFCTSDQLKEGISGAARRIFYEAQLMFVEGLSRSASGRYLACAVVIATLTTYLSSHYVEKVERGVQHMQAACFSNAAMCLSRSGIKLSEIASSTIARVSTTNRVSDETKHEFDDVSSTETKAPKSALLSMFSICGFTPAELCDLAIDSLNVPFDVRNLYTSGLCESFLLRSNIALRLRKVHCLEAARLYTVALSELRIIRSTLEQLKDHENASLVGVKRHAFVIDYGPKMRFSQQYISGESFPMAALNEVPEGNVFTEQILCREFQVACEAKLDIDETRLIHRIANFG